MRRGRSAATAFGRSALTRWCVSAPGHGKAFTCHCSTKPSAAAFGFQLWCERCSKRPVLAPSSQRSCGFLSFDDALRQRAFEAVQRALAAEMPPV